MTGTLPSSSPLNDPRLSAQIQARLQQGRGELERAEAQRDLYFLERYGWQEYPAKCGRWRVGHADSALTSGGLYSGPWTKREWTGDPSWVLLLDPASRQPIAAHIVPNWWIDDPSRRPVLPVNNGMTSFWLAGDPRVAGMFTPAGNGHRAVFGHRVGHTQLGYYRNWLTGPARFEQLAAVVAARPFVDSAPREYGPWIADHPEPPPRPKRFHSVPRIG